MTLVTSTSDPTLHAKLSTAWNDLRKPGWVMDRYDHYRVVFLTSGEVAFSLDTNRSLYDSRSVTNGKPATYTKLDK